MNFIEFKFSDHFPGGCGLPGGLWTSPTWHQRSVRAGLSVRWRQQKSWKPGTVAFTIPTLHTQGPQKTTKSFHEIDMQFPWSVLLLGTLKDVQRKRSLWMNMLELRLMVCQSFCVDIFRVFQIFRSSSEKFNIWCSSSTRGAASLRNWHWIGWWCPITPSTLGTCLASSQGQTVSWCLNVYSWWYHFVSLKLFTHRPFP